ncbi:hypothetical protein [Parasphingorhabdus sp.]|uniref:hypothetical protein n=1 Tax=Parasphingorhabdus sp. TaxID=2709688 RepID=UPI0032675347
MLSYLRKFKHVAFAGILVASSAPVAAWDGTTTGKVTQIDITTPGPNYDFRVYLEGFPGLCTAGHTWAFINTGDTNYETIASALMLAYSTGKTVTIYTNDSTSGYCKIGYVVLRP